MLTVKCLECKKPFEAQRSSAKFCSPNCRVKWNQQIHPSVKTANEIPPPFPSWVKEVEDFCSNEGITHKELIKGYLNSKSKPVIKATSPKIREREAVDKSSGYNPFKNPAFIKKMGQKETKE